MKKEGDAIEDEREVIPIIVTTADGGTTVIKKGKPAAMIAETETKFGLGQLSTQTPMWAKWIFRITFILTTVAAFIIASDPGIPDALKVRIGVYLKGIDMVIFGLSKMFGVELKDEEAN